MAVDDSVTQRHPDEELLVEIQLDRDSAQDDQGDAAYQCAVCQLAFPAQDVYESEGSIICTACWNRAQIAAGAGANKPATAPPPRPKPPARAPLLARITCPHCWYRFLPQDILWVARHGELIGDPVAGPDAALRFLPSSFTADGAARDSRGLVCQSLACPNCHLIIPRPLVEIEPLFASIVGVSSSGKSYFLTAMTWELRRLLPLYFGVSFSDADATFNRALNQQEESLFLPADPDRPVKLDQTDAAGARIYDEVRLGDQTVSLSRPSLFTMRPSGKHPNADYASHLARVVALYDNAGEHFNAGPDTASYLLTQHLGSARVLMFLYDLTQDPRFRARLRGFSADPQLNAQFPARRQETILIETANRVRHFAGLPAGKPINRPLVVVIPKADVWGKLVDLDLSKEPIVPNCVANNTLAGVDLDRVESVSKVVREMLLSIAPEFVASAEEFSSNVIYIPVSALGSSPEMIGGREGLWIRPSHLKPQWVTVPFLYMFARWTHDVIARVRWQKNKS